MRDKGGEEDAESEEEDHAEADPLSMIARRQTVQLMRDGCPQGESDRSADPEEEPRRDEKIGQRAPCVAQAARSERKLRDQRKRIQQ